MAEPFPIAAARARPVTAGMRVRDDHRRLSDAELLGMIVGSSRDVAASLLDEAGGLGSVGAVERSPSALAMLRPAQRRRLERAVELSRRLATARTEPGWRVRSPADVGERMLPAMRHLEREELRTLLLNTKNVVVAAQTVYVGNLAGSSVRVGEVFRDAVRRQAAALVVVHNHPSGDPTPSADDLRITAELAEAGRLLDIELLDHVVIGADSWISLRALGAT
jgi:DNA repair protein RadC